MPTVTKAANASPVIDSPGFTNPANAFSTAGDNVYATIPLSKNGSATTGNLGSMSFPGFTAAEIPDNATITAVRIVFEWAISASVTGMGIAAAVNKVWAGVIDSQTTKTTVTEEALTLNPSTLPTPANVRSDDWIRCRYRAWKGNTNTASDLRLDFVRIEVDFTVPASSPGTGTQPAILSVGASQLAGTATGRGRGVASLQSIVASALVASPKAAASVTAGLVGAAATTLAPSPQGKALVTAGVLTVPAFILDHAARGSADATVDLLVVVSSPLDAQPTGGAETEADFIAAGLSVLEPDAMGAGETLADLLSFESQPYDPTVTGAALAQAGLLGAGFSILTPSVGGGQQGVANADLVGISLSPLEVALRAGAAVEAELLQAGWTAYDATVGGAQAATAQAALLTLGTVLNGHVATGEAVGLAGVVGILSEALDASASGAGVADAPAISVTVTVLPVAVGQPDAVLFVGEASATPSLNARQTISLSLRGRTTVEVSS